MARGVRLKRARRSIVHEPGTRAWLLLCALLGLGAAGAWVAPANVLDWQPSLAMAQPWRAWTAAFVHWSPMHLGANAIGLAVVAALGAAARVPPRLALAWFVAWPLTQWGLWLRPELAHFGGLSGVLHAAVGVVCVGLLATHDRPRQAIGAAIAVGLLIKLGTEAPWGPVLRTGGGWDIAVAPWSHASGAFAGALCAGVALTWPRSGTLKHRPIA